MDKDLLNFIILNSSKAIKHLEAIEAACQVHDHNTRNFHQKMLLCILDGIRQECGEAIGGCLQ